MRKRLLSEYERNKALQNETEKPRERRNIARERLTVHSQFFILFILFFILYIIEIS